MSDFMKQYYIDHPIVDCDSRCGALHDPKTMKEIKAALVHWRDHGQLGGCSHGC